MPYQKREQFIIDLIQLRSIIAHNQKHNIKTGPIIKGLYLRLTKVFPNK